MDEEIRIEKLKVEKLKIELELAKLNCKIINSKKSNTKSKFYHNTPIYIAIIGIIGSAIITSVEGIFATKQKKIEFESSLIFRAVEPGDSILSRRNLKFLIDTRLINDKDDVIKKIISDKSYKIPSFSDDFGLFANQNGKKYHSSYCKMLNNYSEEISEVDIKTRHLLPCKMCKPSLQSANF